ncbi:hypothetical protein FNV43_RR18523 [Rhamnella rubrinervis]|uniref:Protein kinase domain-containing protein n=1 Tax=Rhamnella rubrinervis TaxID=2594499 RepID=A0A8K0DZJ7_9ROSA|nr:hypothetical protein FNV43_RR18523 [Rhamnella rubrinervis]
MSKAALLISLCKERVFGAKYGAVADLKSLTGLYLHFNALNGKIPEEITSLNELADLYLNVNNLSGEIPPGLGTCLTFKLCYNRLTGSIPTQLGYLKKLNVLALQYNQLTGAIPASLGELGRLTRLDLSFNNLFSSVPAKLADASMLKVLDIRNNSLSGNIPAVIVGTKTDRNHMSPLIFLREIFRLSQKCIKKDIPESANLHSNCSKSHCSKTSSRQIGVVLGVIGVLSTFTVTGLFTFSWYRRRKQKIGSTFETSDNRQSTDQAKEACRKSSSPLINLEYSNGWDPLARGGSGFSEEILESFMFNLEEVERATQCFSKVNLLGKSNFSAIYKGILRDGSLVAVKCIAKTSCKSDEAEFLKGFKVLTSLKHDNLEHSGMTLEWSTRVSIISGIAKGILYLHGRKGNKPALIHQNLSAEKVLLDACYKPVVSDSGLHKLLADDVVFSMLKASAAKGYLAPDYTATGRFTAKSDVYAFGMIVFQILTGKQKVTQLVRQGAESCRFEDFIDADLEGKFSETEAAKLGRIALLCTHESPDHRPSMENVMQEMSGFVSSFGSS